MTTAIQSSLVREFDIWREGYAGAVVTVYKGGTARKASLFSDPTLTTRISNPVTLLTDESDGRLFGKFPTKVYLAGKYHLAINGSEVTGIVNSPLTSMVGQEISTSLAKSRRGTRLRTIQDRAGTFIDILDMGAWGHTNTSENTATLEAAIGSAAGDGGGTVLLPAGTYPVTNFTLPAGVVLEGRGDGVTVLQSEYGGTVCTIGGAGAGFRDMTLDGVNLNALSIGIYGLSADRIVFERFTVKRFETGIKFKGGRGNFWRQFTVYNCGRGAYLLGDVGASEANAGDLWELNVWFGGKIEACTTAGLTMEFVDRELLQNRLIAVDVTSNTPGPAIELIGCNGVTLSQCAFEANDINWQISDGSDADYSPENEVRSILVEGGFINTGRCDFDGLSANVQLHRVDLIGCQLKLAFPTNEILLVDCTEDAAVTFDGDTSKVVRHFLASLFELNGLTTDSSWLTAFSRRLDHGQIVYQEAVVIANERNGTDRGRWHVSMTARRPPAELDFDTQTAGFTVGDVLTGATSGATARIVAQVDAGATGTLSLRDVFGEFIDNEIIEDTSGGSASVNGTLEGQNAQLMIEGSLAYDGQTANFTVGQVVNGGTTGTKGTITADTDGGATGTLTLRDWSGPGFADNEALTDPLGGSATVNGAVTLESLTTAIVAAVKTNSNFGVRFSVSGALLQIDVKGDTSRIVEWLVQPKETLD